ncbi:hypothetical protein B0I35DRAFT_111521 [Stachybotrys elegans]|uniref:Uncharacterized protein n=1 Tax=Stachybotrys elegans TaxID=80388 RepID=A0A8K0SHK1_9HYPO|nr:hypothetical protein B0I35DRAFT_111521 [Stachybotrys elegans]
MWVGIRPLLLTARRTSAKVWISGRLNDGPGCHIPAPGTRLVSVLLIISAAPPSYLSLALGPLPALPGTGRCNVDSSARASSAHRGSSVKMSGVMATCWEKQRQKPTGTGTGDKPPPPDLCRDSGGLVLLCMKSCTRRFEGLKESLNPEQT